MSAAEHSVTPSSEFAMALLLALVERGVSHVVVSPGSRSQALALAAAELEQAGMVTLHVRVDERDAAFLALGIGMTTGLPAPVITTSGSAVANLMPAAMEAARARVPMLLLTADRPQELRGTGANQTTHQAGILGVLASLDYDIPVSEYSDDPVGTAVSLAEQVVPFPEGNRPGLDAGHLSLRGPMQVNLQFEEPLSGPHTPLAPLRLSVQQRLDSLRPAHPVLNATRRESVRIPAAEAVLVAGLGADLDLVRHAHEAGVPVIAEITSNARAWHTVDDYRRWLEFEAAEAPGALGVRTLVVTGLPSLSRQVWRFAEREDVQVVTAAPAGGEYFSPGHRARRVDLVRFDAAAPSLRAKKHRDDGELTSRSLRSKTGMLTREAVVEAVWRHSTATVAPAEAGAETGMKVDPEVDTGACTDAIYLASSRMVRVADERVGSSPVPVYAHRGLAGIDGTISAASGVAVARYAEAARLVRLIIGDLAFAHDVGGLLRPECEPAPHLQIIVVNDHGGSIFSGLEVARADPTLYDRVVRTPQPLHVPDIAAAYQWPYSRAHDVDELDRIVGAGEPGIIEVVIEA